MRVLRIFLCIALFALAGAARAQQGGPAPAGEFLTEWLEYVAWDGSHWSARREAGGFMHVRRGASQGQPDAALNYKGWDDGQWSSRWNGDVLQHARQGESRAQHDGPLQFVDWYGRKWSARWDAPARKFRVRAGA